MASSTNLLGLRLDAPAALVIDLLRWLAERPRSYRETMEAWRTSCPRLPVWEDAIDNGLVELLSDTSEGGELAVGLTARGRSVLGGTVT